MHDCVGDGGERPLAYLSGPAFAAEIAQGLVTAVTVASYDRELANDLMELLASANFRALYTPDVIGLEARTFLIWQVGSGRGRYFLIWQVGGAVKNVIAIAAGMCEGLGTPSPRRQPAARRSPLSPSRHGRRRSGYERDGRASDARVQRDAQVSGGAWRDSGEMRRDAQISFPDVGRLVYVMGGEPSTVMGLSGVGDTFGTCFGPLSRNRQDRRRNHPKPPYAERLPPIRVRLGRSRVPHMAGGLASRARRAARGDPRVHFRSGRGRRHRTRRPQTDRDEGAPRGRSELKSPIN